MSNESANLDGSDGEQIDERTAKFIGMGSGVMNGIALAAASYFVFETNVLVFGVVVGLFSGIGSALFIPWILTQQAEAADDEAVEESPSYSSPTEEDSGGLNTAALGAGLEAGAIGMFAARVALEEFALAVGAGVAVALGVFLFASVLFGRVE
jgi:hypothetical protein